MSKSFRYVDSFEFPSSFGFSGSGKGPVVPRSHSQQQGQNAELSDGTYVSKARGGRMRFDAGGEVLTNSASMPSSPMIRTPDRAADYGDESDRRSRNAAPMPKAASPAPVKRAPAKAPARSAAPAPARSAMPERDTSRNERQTNSGVRSPDLVDRPRYDVMGNVVGTDTVSSYAKGGPLTAAIGNRGARPLGAMSGGAPGRSAGNTAMRSPTGNAGGPAPASPAVPAPLAAQAVKGAAMLGRVAGAKQAMRGLGAVAPGAAGGAPPGPSPVPAAAPPQMAKGGHLSMATRKSMPNSDFALPGKGSGASGKGPGSYPIPDASHARNALSRVAQHGSAGEKAAVRAKVHSKFPKIGKADGGAVDQDADDFGHNRPAEYGATRQAYSQDVRTRRPAEMREPGTLRNDRYEPIGPRIPVGPPVVLSGTRISPSAFYAGTPRDKRMNDGPKRYPTGDAPGDTAEAPTRRYAKGGHADAAQDRALIKQMLKQHEKGEGEMKMARGGYASLPRGMKPATMRKHSPIGEAGAPTLKKGPRNAYPGGQMGYGVQPSSEPDRAGSDQTPPVMAKGGRVRSRC